MRAWLWWWILGSAAAVCGLALVVLLDSGVFGCGTPHTEQHAAEMDMKGLEQGLHMYHLRFARYPSSDEGLAALYASGILRGSLKSDPWGNAYHLLPPREVGGSPEILSSGEDGLQGTDDDISSVPPTPSCFLGLCF